MYQYAKNPCEHLTPNNTCKIYPNRPTVCQAFPAETTPIGTFLHRECTQIAKLLKEGETITSDMIKGLEKEIQASETFSQHIRKAIKQAGSPAWAFDLKTKKWKKLTEG
jgi:Fe-S-cluster containining protein